MTIQDIIDKINNGQYSQYIFVGKSYSVSVSVSDLIKDLEKVRLDHDSQLESIQRMMME